MLVPVIVFSDGPRLDIFPTFCELAGVPLPDGRTIDGRSLVSLLTGGREQPLHPFVYHT